MFGNSRYTILVCFHFCVCHQSCLPSSSLMKCNRYISMGCRIFVPWSKQIWKCARVWIRTYITYSALDWIFVVCSLMATPQISKTGLGCVVYVIVFVSSHSICVTCQHSRTTKLYRTQTHTARRLYESKRPGQWMCVCVCAPVSKMFISSQYSEASSIFSFGVRFMYHNNTYASHSFRRWLCWYEKSTSTYTESRLLDSADKCLLLLLLAFGCCECCCYCCCRCYNSCELLQAWYSQERR